MAIFLSRIIMTTINFQNKKDTAVVWPQVEENAVPINNNWQANWHDYCAFIAQSVISFTQASSHRAIIAEVVALCQNHTGDRAIWQSTANNARIAISAATALDHDEESRAAMLTILAIAQVAISADKQWLLKATAMSIHAISEGWSAYAFGCSKATVAKIASEKAKTELVNKFAELSATTAFVHVAKVA